MATRPAPELVDRFRTILGRFPQAERRTVFGLPAAFVGGNLATAIVGRDWIVRLGPASTRDVIAAGRASSFQPPAGRPMPGFVLVPAADAWDDEAIVEWVGRALAYAGSLPRKR